MSQMGLIPQLVDVISLCSEGWEGPELASGPRYAMLYGLLGSLVEELHVLSMTSNGKWSHPRPKEAGA